MTLLGKIPPQAIEFEQAVLGAILLEREAIISVLDVLTPEKFYKSQHSAIYGAILALYGKGEPIDILSVRNYLSKSGELESIGGAYYLSELTSKIASSANIEYHCRIIIEKWMLRELIRNGQAAVEAGYAHDTDEFEAIEQLENELFKLISSISGKNEANINREYLSKYVLELEKTVASANRGDVIGIPSGLNALDKELGGLRSSDLIIIAARPAMGKTSLALNIALNCGCPAGFFSLEMSTRQLMNRAISQVSGVDNFRIQQGKIYQDEWDSIHEASDKIADMGLIIDDTPGISIVQLRGRVKSMVRKNKIGLLLVDYLQLIHSREKGQNREQEINTISRTLKEIAKENDIPVIALSQLSRAVEVRGGDKKPILSDLRESGAIEQDADIVIFPHRPEYYDIKLFDDGTPTEGIAELVIAKNRNGGTGSVMVGWDKRHTKFHNLNDQPQF